MLLFPALVVLTFLLFIRIPKRLSRFEILGCWLLTTIYHEDFLVISSINLGLIETKKQVLTVFVIVANRLLLFPMLSVLYVDQVERRRSLLQKAPLLILFAGVMLLLQYLTNWQHLYHFKRWSLWWSVWIWTTEGILLVAAQQGFRKLAREVKQA